MTDIATATEAPRPAPAVRVMLILLQIAAVVVGLIATLYGLLFTSWAYQGKMGEFFFDVRYVSDDYPAVVAEAEIWQSFNTITISSHEALVLPRTLAAIAAAMPFLIVLIACICVFILAARIRSGRPFSRAAQVVLGLLGLVSAVSAILVPWLESQISIRAIAELGLPSNYDSGVLVAQAWVVPTYFDLVQDMNWPLFTLGITLLLVTLLWQQAARMQREQEGLV